MILRKNTLKYKMLEFLAFLGDGAIELLMNEVLVSGTVRMPNRKHYSSRHFERVLKELTSTGFIKRVNKDGTIFLKLTSQANYKIARHVPLPYLQKKKWSGYFTALAYDFPEKKKFARDQLRKLVQEWGMGQFQLSLYITPHPLKSVIEEFIEAQNISEYAFCLTTGKLSIKEGRRIAEKVWRIEKLEEHYWEFIGKWEDNLLDEKIKIKDIEKIRFEYFSLIEKDPHLPFDLLPEDWPCQRAKEAYITVEQAIKKLSKKKTNKYC